MEEFLRFNIAVIPPEKERTEAIKLSERLSKLGDVGFVLDGINFHPHITCYSPAFPRKNLEKIFQKLEEITSEYKSFHNNLIGLNSGVEGERSGIGVDLEKSEEVDRLHRVIIGALNPFREGHFEDKYKNDDYFLAFPEGKRELIKKIAHETGYPRVLDVYSPHISIINYSDPKLADKVVKEYSWSTDVMKVSEIGVFTMGSYGTCKKLLKSFPLR